MFPTVGAVLVPSLEALHMFTQGQKHSPLKLFVLNFIVVLGRIYANSCRVLLSGCSSFQITACQPSAV